MEDDFDFESYETPDNWESVLDDYDFLTEGKIDRDKAHEWLSNLDSEDFELTPESLDKLIKAAPHELTDGFTDFIKNKVIYPNSEKGEITVATDKDGDGDIGKSASIDFSTLSDATMKNIASALSTYRY